MKTQKYAVFIEKKMKINMYKVKKYCNVRDHIHYTGK